LSLGHDVPLVLLFLLYTKSVSRVSSGRIIFRRRPFFSNP
jgi:hypothetical protein